MWVCVYVYMCVRIRIGARYSMYVGLCVCIYVCSNTYRGPMTARYSVYVCIYYDVCVCVCVYVCSNTNRQPVCMYVYMCVQIQIGVQ